MDNLKDFAGLAGIVLAVIVALIVAGVGVRRYRIANPSEALIVVGRKGGKPVLNPETGESSMDLSGQKVVMGGGVFVKPFVEQSYPLSLASRSIRVQIRGAVSKQGIRLNLDAVAIVKVGGAEAAVRAAAQRFLHQQEQIEAFTQEVLAGSLRSIVGTLTVDEIIRDRAAFARQVADESVTSLNNQGLVLDTFQIQDVSDDSNYLRDLGRPEAAAAARNAAIAEARASQESSQAESVAQVLIAESQRDLALRQAEFKADTDRAQANAAAAGDLAKADQDQEVLTAQERVAERQAALTERTLDTDVRKPADAARYKQEQEAQANRNAVQFEAEGRAKASVADSQASAERVRLTSLADAERVRISSEAEAASVRVGADAELARRSAQASATQLEGEAEAAAVQALGHAQAQARKESAAAFEQYGEAARLQLVVEVLPEMAKALAAPLGSIKDLTVISNDGAGALSRSVANNLQETLETVRRTTGVDVVGILKGFGDLAQAPHAEPAADAG
ncbi:flotillin family protein [Pengzhenrongella sicca]|uniref:Flotillin family protein n=1 Tax=Pengzhenrongella sicca TaxID=2819238 RepID=A0A8A4ZG49_9MICO|nr:SPFH domain-containing protein [Pengzhenrongella sicca]QTE30874.1 flotillin family protein [Pengzhenrongella sicca]